MARRWLKLDAEEAGRWAGRKFYRRFSAVERLAHDQGRRLSSMTLAEMDALPITEANEVPYRSRNLGVMHACGHDGHSSVAAAVAARLVEAQGELAGTVKFAFQPAEETDLEPIPGHYKNMLGLPF